MANLTFFYLSLAPGACIRVSLDSLDLGGVDVLHRAEGVGRVQVGPVAAAGA